MLPPLDLWGKVAGERGGGGQANPPCSQNVKRWKVARVGPVLPERAASEGGRRGSSQTVLLARRAPTMRRWSLDARSEGQPGCSLLGEQRAPIRPCWTGAVGPTRAPFHSRARQEDACSWGSARPPLRQNQLEPRRRLVVVDGSDRFW